MCCNSCKLSTADLVCCLLLFPAAPYLPLNPDMIFPSSVDIYPGLSGPLMVLPEVWNSFALSIPDHATLQYLYDTGRRDAAHWAATQQLAPPERITAALLATTVAS